MVALYILTMVHVIYDNKNIVKNIYNKKYISELVLYVIIGEQGEEV